METTLFYDELSRKLGLPFACPVAGWASHGREVVAGSRPRFVHSSGVFFYGIESTSVSALGARGVEAKTDQTLADLLRKAGQGLPSKTPTLDKLEAEHAGNAAMITRDGPAKQTFIRFTCVDCTGCAKCAPVSTAKPALSFLTLSPDLQPSSHQVGPAFGSALLRG